MNNFYKKSTVSVSMILFNRWQISKRCIESIKKTIPQGWNIQWSVIDNGSSDETKEQALKLLEETKDEIVFFQRLEEPMQATRVANRSMNYCTGQLILRTDNDIEYKQGWFEDCLKILTDPAFKDLAFICPTHHLRQAIKGYKPHLVTGTFSKVDMFPYYNGMNVPINVLAKTEVMKDIGGIYTPYNLLHCDVHHCLVAKNMGYKFGYTWDTQCNHIGDASLNEEYYHKSRHERFSEDARFNAIAKGDFKDKHPQEIEFVHHINEMKNRYIQKLPYHKIKILFVGDPFLHMFKQDFLELLKISKTDRFDFEFKIIKKPDYIEVEKACKEDSVNYLIPLDRDGYRFAHKYKIDLLRSVGTECIVTSYENIENIFNLECLTEIGFNKKSEEYGDMHLVHLVSDRRFDIVSFVSLKTKGFDEEIVNNLHFYSYLNNLSKHLQIFGPWHVSYFINKDGGMEINSIDPYINQHCLTTEKSGQNQFQITLKILSRDFFGYHYRYTVDWGLKYKYPSIFYYGDTPCLKRL